MGSLITHISTFLLLFPIGVRRLLCCSTLYLQNPSIYRSKPWFFSEFKWKNLEFYALLLALPIASLTDLTLFLTFSEHPSHKFSFLQQSIVYFLFWVLQILILYREFCDTQIINESLTFLLAGVSFFVEYFLNGNGFVGVSSNVYDLLGRLTLVCGCSCFYLSIRPNAFFADFFLSSGLVFKATWVLQAGFNLYSDVLGLKGCSRVSVWPGLVKADVKCDLPEDSLRAIALIGLLFVIHAIGVFVLAFAVLWSLSCNLNWRFGVEDVGGPLLAQIDSESLLMTNVPNELEMD